MVHVVGDADGDARHVGIGSDLDGGYGSEQTPADLDTIADLRKLPDLLHKRGYAEEDFSVIARKYFPEMQMPTVEQDLELFEKPPPIEPAATISSMGEVAAAVQPEVDLAPPPATEPEPQLQPAIEQFVSPEPSGEATAPATVESNQPEAPVENAVSPESAPEPQAEESAATKSPMNMLAKLLRGDSARPDES